MNAPAEIEIYKALPVAALHSSPTNPRKRFDETALKQLSESVLNDGVLQPLVVRPHPRHEGSYEIVAGERRWRAAKLVGLTAVPCVLRMLTDEQVALLQTVENLQREDLHPLEEAEGYEHLAKVYHYTVDDIAAKVAKSASYVRGRMKLTALSAKAREWFYKGLLTPTTALLVARIPVPSLQDEALTGMVDHRGQPLHATDAAAYIQRDYMLDLSRAPFPTGDETLTPKAGACGPCVKRTGNQPELFGDVKQKNTCTDPTCWNGKRAAHVAKQKAEAEAKGMTVITGKAAKKILPHGDNFIAESHLKLDDRCWDDAKGRTYRELLGRDAPAPTLVETSTGGLLEVVERKVVAPILREKGVHRPGTDRDREKEAAAKVENEVRAAIFTAIRNTPVKIERDELAMIAIAWARDLDGDTWKRIEKLWAWEKSTPDKAIGELETEQLSRLLLDMALIGETRVQAWSLSTKHELLDRMAARTGVDATAIRKKVKADARAAAKAKAAKKAAKTKSTKAAPPAPAEKAEESKPARQKRPGGNRRERVPKDDEAQTPVEAKAPPAVGTWPFPSRPD